MALAPPGLPREPLSRAPWPAGGGRLAGQESRLR